MKLIRRLKWQYRVWKYWRREDQLCGYGYNPERYDFSGVQDEIKN